MNTVFNTLFGTQFATKMISHQLMLRMQLPQWYSTTPPNVAV